MIITEEKVATAADRAGEGGGGGGGRGDTPQVSVRVFIVKLPFVTVFRNQFHQ